MAQPYGLCELTDAKPMSDCLLECRTREITKRCGCRDVYMTNLTLSEYFPVSDSNGSSSCINVWRYFVNGKTYRIVRSNGGWVELS